jgi:hypothetical protein
MVFSGMLLLLHTRLMHDSHLLWACYLILLLCTTFCAVALPIEPAATTKRHVAAEGVWQVSFRKHSSALSLSRGRIALASKCKGGLLPSHHVFLEAMKLISMHITGRNSITHPSCSRSRQVQQ